MKLYLGTKIFVLSFFFFFVKMLLYGKKGSTSICISMAIEGNAIKQ